MLILTLKTDNPEAELELYEDQKKLKKLAWTAHKELAETIHTKIKELLVSSGHDWKDINGLVVYKGPGSFTGLRIGLSVANTLAYAGSVPIVGGSGQYWYADGIKRLLSGENTKIVVPLYGSPPNVTRPKGS